jgi:hypothetical protein
VLSKLSPEFILGSTMTTERSSIEAHPCKHAKCSTVVEDLLFYFNYLHIYVTNPCVVLSQRYDVLVTCLKMTIGNKLYNFKTCKVLICIFPFLTSKHHFTLFYLFIISIYIGTSTHHHLQSNGPSSFTVDTPRPYSRSDENPTR